MRPARKVLLGAIAAASVACAPSGASQQQPVNVFVPQGQDEAGVDATAADGGFGLGLVDRDGRPLVTTLLVAGNLQDEYNAQPTFDVGLNRVLQQSIESRLETLDTLVLGDGGPDPVDWPISEGGTHPLLPVLAADFLLVDPALPCTTPTGGFTSSYFEIERELYLGGPTHTTCGGRTPSDDVIDTTLTLLITGDGGRAQVTDGVPTPTKPATTTFPYLAPPN